MILGQGGSTARVIVLFCIAFLVYLYQSGFIRVNRVEAPAPPLAAQDDNAEGEVRQHTVSRRNVVVAEVLDFFVPFFLSLFPAWTPDQYRNPRPAAAPVIPPEE